MTWNKFAVCIGINDYPGTNSDLAGCVNDVDDWSKALKARGFKVFKLIDSQATGRGMRDLISGVVTGLASAGDTVVVQYSGHGSFVPDKDGDEADGTDECLIPHDVLTNGVITDDELSLMFSAAAPGVKVVFVADSCHSGTVARFAPILTPKTTKSKTAPARLVRFLPPATFLEKRKAERLGILKHRAASPPGRQSGALLLAGCQDWEYSFDGYFNGRPNGLFSFVCLREMRKTTFGRYPTYSDLYRRIRQVLPSQQYAQTPNLVGTSAMKRWPAFR